MVFPIPRFSLKKCGKCGRSSDYLVRAGRKSSGTGKKSPGARYLKMARYQPGRQGVQAYWDMGMSAKGGFTPQFL
jgi:hypothetical protein